MIRTLLFLVLMYLLIKLISRLFLSPQTSGSRNNASFFHQTFRQFQQGRQQQERNTRSGSQHFEEIEEAEYEDITEEDTSTSKSPD